MLTVERLREVLRYEPETGIFYWVIGLAGRAPAGSIAGCCAEAGRIKIRIDGKLYLAHRLAWLYMTGNWPTEIVDHINGVQSDNRFKNLREASKMQNSWNSTVRSDNLSGIKGVHFDKIRNKWRAELKAGGKTLLAKRFETEQAARDAYESAALKYHGEFAALLGTLAMEA